MISFVCGQLCCGKTVFAKTMSGINDGVYVEIGDIVRNIKKSQDRKELQNSQDLAEQIIEFLNYYKTNSKHVIISGPRQVEILKAFPEATLLWIECPTSVRKERYEARAREGDSLSFEEADKGDVELGILKIKQYILEHK